MKSFLTFRLDCVNHCLWRGEERLSLAPKAFDVLRYLVEHADRLVTQEEILEALWPGTYVNPEVVKKYVLGIRKVLGDQSAKPAFVATFPRRGYQFIAPVYEEGSSPVASFSKKGARTIVGREGAINRLEDALKNALQGRRQILFITGEAGIGKTTLVDVFLQKTGLYRQVRIARGQCVEGFGGKEAYYPVLEALAQLLNETDQDPVFQAFSKRAPTWLVQFPSMIDGVQQEALEKQIIGATRERMVREICEALEFISARTPLVLCLEDLHWVDSSTLDFLSALARRRGPAKLLLLGTYRPADIIISQSPLKGLKQDLLVHDLCSEVALERLDESDVAKYLNIEFGDADFPAEFANLVYRRSGGNALFMVASLQDMVEKELIQQADARWSLMAPLEKIAVSVPETLDQLIELQFQQLNEVEQCILKAASVAGEIFPVWAITTAVELNSGRIEEVCEKLSEKHQFIRAAGIHEMPNGQISAHYEFRHSFYREVLYRRLSEVSRSKLHLLLARRLKAFCDPCEQESATELALHFEGGYDYGEAVHYLILAAKNAAQRFSHRDSIEILGHGLTLSAKLGPALRDEIDVQIFESIGDAQFALGALGESAQSYATAATRAHRAGLKKAQLHALTSAMYPLGFIDPGLGIAAVEEAVKVSMSANDPHSLALAQMLAAACRLVWDAWTQSDADLCTSAYETLVRLDMSPLDATQQIAYAHVLVLKGSYKEAMELSEGSVSNVVHGVNAMAHFGALSTKTSALLRMGQLGKVLQITKSGRTTPEENMALYWLLSFREAWVRTLAFDFEGARRICQATGKTGGEHPDSQAQTIDQMAAGYIALQAGDYDEALAHFSNVHEPPVCEKFFLHWAWRMMARLESINVRILAGDLSNAHAAADGYLQSALAVADPQMRALAWDMKARLALAECDLTGARECIEQALAIVEEFEILVAAWQTFATASQINQHAREHKAAEMYRVRAESCILKIADSFESEEPLRATFLAAAPVRQLLGTANQSARQNKQKRRAAS